MFKRTIFNCALMFFMLGLFSVSFGEENEKSVNFSNRLFSVELPYKMKDFYLAKKRRNNIYIYHKTCKQEGFGGYAFGIELYKNPSDHAMMPGGQKLGEIVYGKNKIYDVVLSQPTDVQCDYTKEMPEAYMYMYKLGNNKTFKIKGKSKSVYYPNQGMKGENLYKEILKKHLAAINEKWDSTRLEQENMSYMYNVINKMCENPLDKIGYTYYDVNGDGIEELFIGEISEGNLKGVAYDIYTMKDRKPVHVISGGARDRYFACDDVFVCREYSSGAKEVGLLVYNLVENSTELFPQVGFKYDGYANENNPYFISYDFDKDEWKNVSKTIFSERKKTFERYERFNYIPFKNFKY